MSTHKLCIKISIKNKATGPKHIDMLPSSDFLDTQSTVFTKDILTCDSMKLTGVIVEMNEMKALINLLYTTYPVLASSIAA